MRIFDLYFSKRCSFLFLDNCLTERRLCESYSSNVFQNCCIGFPQYFTPFGSPEGSESCETQPCGTVFFCYRFGLRAPRPHTGTVSRCTPGRSPYHSKQVLRSRSSNGPIPFPQHLFQCPRSRTATLEKAATTLTCPHVGLAVHRAVSSLFQQGSTTGK